MDYPETITTILSENRISGLIFLKMTNDLKELIPTIGDRIIVKNIKDSLCRESEVVSEISNYTSMQWQLLFQYGLPWK